MNEPNPYTGSDKLYMPGFAQLRTQALHRFVERPLLPWSQGEVEGFSRLFAVYTHRYLKSDTEQSHNDWRCNPGFEIVMRDLDDGDKPMLPKWLCLVNWLAPESVVSHAPDFMAELARLVFGNHLATYHP